VQPRSESDVARARLLWSRLGASKPSPQVLSDEDLRRKYDEGEDVSGNPGEQQQQEQQGGMWMNHGGQHVHVRFR